MTQQRREAISGTGSTVTAYLAAAISCAMFFPCLVFVLELFAQTSLFKWQLPIAVAFATPLALLGLLKQQSTPVKIAALLAFLCMAGSALALAGSFYDVSWDGRAYHADAILLLLQDVNPLYEHMRGFDDLWTNNYPKISWYFAAITTHATGNYNFGKSYNLLLAYAAAAYAFHFFRERGLSTGNALLVSLVAGANPVAMSQVHCYYVDGALASMMTLLILSALKMLNSPKTEDKLVFFATSCLLINLKFTGVVFVALIYGVLAIVMLLRWFKSRLPEDFTQGRKLAGLMLLVGLVGGAIVGFNPYVTNIMVHDNIFYPLRGIGSIDIINAQSPLAFVGDNMGTMRKVLVSIFSRTDNIAPQGGTAEPQLKLPFTTDAQEWGVFFSNDVRLAGWGVFFSGALLLAAGLYIAMRAWEDTGLTLALVIIALTIVVNPGSWWARYAPQIALLPLLMSIPALASTGKWPRITAKFTLALLLLNSALIVLPNTEFFYRSSKQLRAQVDAMLAECGRGQYEIFDMKGYHFEQFLLADGITVTYPGQDNRKPHAESELFPLRDVFLYKEGCVRH